MKPQVASVRLRHVLVSPQEAEGQLAAGVARQGRHRRQGPLVRQERRDAQAAGHEALQQQPLQEDPEAVLEHATLGAHGGEELWPQKAAKSLSAPRF